MFFYMYLFYCHVLLYLALYMIIDLLGLVRYILCFMSCYMLHIEHIKTP